MMNSDLKTFSHNNINISYRDFGAGNPMIFLHGFGASSYIWNKIESHFAQNNRVILIDLKGFGLSDKPEDNKYKIDDQAEIIIDFIKRNNLRDIVLVGHSLGGAIALSIYLKSTEQENNLIKRLILIDSPAYKQKLPSFIKLLGTPILNKIILFLLPARLKVKIIFKKCFFDKNKITPEMIEKYAEPLKSKGANYALIETAKELLRENNEDIGAKYKKINIPTLLIWGKEDKIVPLTIGERLQKDIPNSKLEIIPECGHIPIEEKPEETIKIISNYL